MSDDVQSEAEAVPGGRTAAAGIGAIAFVALCAGGVWLAYPQVRAPSAHPPAQFPGVGLEVTPVADQTAYMTRQRALLGGGGGRLPIAEAMDEIVRRATLEPEGRP